MDLSIIVPVHNLENYIQPLLSTLWNQNVNGIQVEYIFVFDRCTDNSKGVVAPWAHKMLENGKATSIQFVDVDFGSLGLTRNAGLDRAIGDYIWFIDGDDWLLTDHAISGLYHAVVDNNIQILRFDFMSIWKDLHPQEGAGWMMVWRYIYSRKLIGSTRFPATQPDEDVTFNLEIFKKVDNKVPQTNSKFYFYNYGRQGSIMMDWEKKQRGE